MSRALVDQVAEPLPEKRLAGPGAYSLRLADIDERIQHTARLHAEIVDRLDRIDKATTDSNRILNEIWVSIKRHPLLNKFLGGK